MSVVVRGLIMPDGCEERKVSCETESGLHCLLVDDGNKWGWKKIESRERPDWCPLRPLPEQHGRLIDADSLKEQLEYYIREAGWDVKTNRTLGWVKDDFIDSEMTIVEAEGE